MQIKSCLTCLMFGIIVGYLCGFKSNNDEFKKVIESFKNAQTENNNLNNQLAVCKNKLDVLSDVLLYKYGE